MFTTILNWIKSLLWVSPKPEVTTQEWRKIAMEKWTQ